MAGSGGGRDARSHVFHYVTAAVALRARGCWLWRRRGGRTDERTDARTGGDAAW